VENPAKINSHKTSLLVKVNECPIHSKLSLPLCSSGLSHIPSLSAGSRGSLHGLHGVSTAAAATAAD